MSYVTAITDRVLSDVTTPTSKGLFNVADWTRVYGNAKITTELTEVMLETPITFNAVTSPTTSTALVSLYTMFNTLLANIERLRLAVAGESIPGTSTEIVDDWTPGPNEDSPDYTDVNLWESTVDAIWDYWGGGDLDVDMVLAEDLIIPTATQLIVVDSIDTAGYNIDIQGTGKLYII